jgi:uncharacterized protein YfaS (alpha-2-macroglobulin family)
MIYKSINLIMVLVFLLTTGAPLQPFLASPHQSPLLSPQISNVAPVQPATHRADNPPEVFVDNKLDLTQLSPFTPLILHFSQTMDQASSTMPLVTYPYVEGISLWSEGNTTLTFTPKDFYEPGEQYTFYLDSGLVNQSGVGFTAVQSWDATIRSGPQVVSVTPSATNLQDRRQVISVTFSHPMDTQSVARSFSIQPQTPFQLSWKENTFTITPDWALSPGKRYSFTIAANARDRQNIPMVEDYRWDYYLAPFSAEVARPLFANAKVTINFSYAIDRQKTGMPFALSPAISGEWEWNTDRQVRFSPTKPWDSAQRYTIRITGALYDQQGDMLPKITTELNFVPPAPISAVFPAADIDYTDELSLFILFDRPMDPTSTENAFEISPAVEGAFLWEGNKLILHAAPALQSGTTYKVTLRATAKDADGHSILAEPYTWSFRVKYSVDRSGAVFSADGPNAQVVDTDGRRAIQLVTHDTKSVHFTLYGMELMDFAQRYAKSFGQRNWYDTLTIDTSGLEPFTSWQTTFADTGIEEVLIPSNVPAGLYVMNASSGGTVYDQLFVIMTRNTLVVKRAGDELFIWASDINGKSLPDYEIRLYSSRGERLRQGVTNQDGVYRTTIPSGYEPMFVAGRDGSDVTISGLSNPWSSSGSWWYWWTTNTSQVKHYTAYIYTDRPIYRPGDMVYFKTTIRQDDDMVYTMPPAGTPLTVRILDGRDNVLQTFGLITNGFGSVDGEFQLTDGAMLGNYNLEVLVNDEAYRQAFKVQDYRKPDYQITIAKDADQYVEGDLVTVDIDASYYFGEPLADTMLIIRRYEILQNYYWWWSEAGSEGKYQWTSIQGTTSGRTDANGHYSYSFKAESNQDYNYADWRSSLQKSLWGLEVLASDGSNQQVSNVVIIPVYNAAYSLSMDTGGYLKQPGQSFIARAELTSLNNEPVSSGSLMLTVSKWSHGDEYTILDDYEMTTDAQGKAEQKLVLTEAGYYDLYVRGSDDHGHQVEYEKWIYVFKESDSWVSRFSQDIQITADKESYRPGNNARFIIESSFSGPAILTFERGSVIHYKPIMLTAPVTIVEAEITYYYSPNVYVAVNAWEAQDTRLSDDLGSWENSMADSRLHKASTEIQVEVIGRRLNVTITPDQPTYAPRENATFTIQVTDEQDQPVEAELSLAVVDEAIYALSSDLSAPIFDAFYGRRNLTVNTFDSMAPTRWLVDFGAGGGGGGDGGGLPRADFPDTAVWQPTIKTDKDGKASVTITLPDSLTTWRLTARAITMETQVGEAVANIITQKELVVRPILPAALTSGDHTEISAILHNYSQNSLTITATLTFTSLLSTPAPLSQVISLAPAEVAQVKWAVTATEAGTTQVTVAAAAGTEYYDAVRLPLTIRPLAVPDFHTQIGDFSGEFRTTLVLPETAMEMSEVEVRLSRSAAGTLLDGLEYLTGYPYGCVEQTMSRALPNAVVGRALYQLGVSDPSLEKSLPVLIRASVQRLYSLQHTDGGWGWWNDDSTNDYQTAWVIFGLATTKEAGYDVDEEVIQRGADWLLENLEPMDIRTRAYALYSLAKAGIGDRKQTQAMLMHLQELDTFSQAALALALNELGDTENARMILDSLSQVASQRDSERGTLVYWPEAHEDGDYHQKTMASTTRSTALVLAAYAQLDPENSLVPGIVRYLMGERQMDGWGTTNETAFAIIALTDYLSYLQRDEGQANYRIELNGSVIISDSLGTNAPFTILKLPASQLKRGANLLNIVKESADPMYYSITSRMYLSQPEIAASGNVLINRAYLNASNNQPITSLQPGQVVRVKLTINIKEGGSFVIIEDQLPGGMEALNESLNTTSHDADMEDYSSSSYFNWERYGYNNKEVHRDRVTFFITNFKPGEHTIVYLARGTHAGTYVAMPTVAYAMYDASLWGRSASEILTISETLKPR